MGVTEEVAGGVHGGVESGFAKAGQPDHRIMYLGLPSDYQVHNAANLEIDMSLPCLIVVYVVFIGSIVSRSGA
jgi:hypothetical protein